MKLLTKIQMINWHYFSNEIIKLGEVNFLTGANSAGKSTIIDALQAALIGETRSSRFNRAAGKKSERTFRSYLVGTLGEDVSSGVKALREGKDFSSYVVAEFYDDFKNERFCLGVVADVFSDGSDERKRWFILEDVIPSHQFIKDGKTTDSTAFLKWGRQSYVSKFQSFDSAQEYNRNVLRKMNVFDPKVFTMLRKAIAFEPISNIEEFITTNICDIEANIDTFAMQENIRNYQLTEQQAKDMEQRLSALTKICEKYEKIKDLRARKMLQQFFIDYGYYRDEQDKLEKTRAKSTELSKIIAEYDVKLNMLSEEAEALKAEGERLNIEKSRFLSETRKDYLELERKNVLEKIESAHITEKALIKNVLSNTGKWMGKCDVMLGEVCAEQAVSAINDLSKTLRRISHFSEQSLGETSVKYFSDIKEKYDYALSMAKPIEERYSVEKQNKTDRIDILQHEIATLNSGRKPYPLNAEKLKNAIRKGLSEKYNTEITVDFLADLIDVTDDEWKNAVEGILGDSRMNIIVSPEYFMDAYYIYKRIHKELKIHEYSVVDLERVFADSQTVKPDSLAQVVKCDNKYVRAYIDYLLCRVIRCYDDEKIRDHHTSVTRDCMLYRSYAVRPINPFHYQNPYIGRRSIEEQLNNKKKELELAEAELTEIGAHLRNAKTFCDAEWFVNNTFIDNVVTPAFEAYSSLPAHVEKLNEINDKLSKIDTAKLDEINKAIKQNNDLQKVNHEKETNCISEKSGALTENKRICELDIPELEQGIAERGKRISEEYDEEFREQKAIPEFEKRLSQYGAPKAFADKFCSPIKQTEKLIDDSEKELLNMRSEYKYKHDHTISFDISNTETNEDFDKERNRISEIALPAFSERITKAKEMAMESFRNDFVNKLKNHIQSVIDQIRDLNRALSKARFGNNTYKFECKPNPDYIEYYDMIMAAEEGETLFSYDFRESIRTP